MIKNEIIIWIIIIIIAIIFMSAFITLIFKFIFLLYKSNNNKSHNHKLHNKKLTNNKSTNNKSTNDKSTNDKSTNDKLTNDKSTNDKSNDNDIINCFSECIPRLGGLNGKIILDCNTPGTQDTLNLLNPQFSPNTLNYKCNKLLSECECKTELDKNYDNFTLNTCNNENCSKYQSYLNFYDTCSNCTPEKNGLKCDKQNITNMCNNLYNICGCEYDSKNKHYKCSNNNTVCKNLNYQLMGGFIY